MKISTKSVKKKILLYPSEKWHSVYNPTIKLLSEKYQVIYNPKQVNSTNKFSKLSRNPWVRYLYYKLMRPMVSLKELKNLVIPSKEEVPSCDLVYASNLIPPEPHKYIIDIENITALGGYDYNRLNVKEIEREFSSKRCIAIICWNDIAKMSLTKTLDCSGFSKKIHVLPFATEQEKIERKNKNNRVNMLFVSSVNNVYDFELKGGIYALESYKILSEKYNNINLSVRAHIPSWVKIKYGNIKGIKFLEEFLSNNEMRDLFLDSDLLIEPVPGINLLLDCMNYAKPASVFNFWMIPEMVIDGKSGMVTDANSILGNPLETKDYLRNLNLRWMRLYSKNIDKDLLEEYVNKTEMLIKNSNSRDKMGKFAKGMISKDGKYNLRRRNDAIIKIVENALQ